MWDTYIPTPLSEIIIYHNPRCGKSRAALEILKETGLPFKTRLYLSDPLTKSELKALLKKLGLKAAELIRTNEDLYKKEYKDKDISETGWITILSENPILIERPIVEKGNIAIVCRPPEKVMELLKD